jgi:hypothetical protein
MLVIRYEVPVGRVAHHNALGLGAGERKSLDPIVGSQKYLTSRTGFCNYSAVDELTKLFTTCPWMRA